ncbi:MAG: DUF6515 family protein [Smithella sp.]
MKNIRSTIEYITLVIALIVIMSMLLGFSQAAYAEEHGSHQGKLDSRYGHNHYYPARGGYVHALPGGARSFVHGGVPYYFHGGVWYRAYGPRFMIVAPPFGLILPLLPPYYATVWVGGVPYYYANEVYYTQTAGGYMVVNPPEGQVVSQTPPPQPPPSPSAATSLPQGEQMFMYPRNGQNEKQQAADRYQCHSWAVNQTNYDPTQPPGGMPSGQKNADYRRAMAACLDAHGYTVK